MKALIETRFLVLPAISMLLSSWTEPVPVGSGIAFRKDDQTIHFLFSIRGCSLASSGCSSLGGLLKAIRAMATIASMSSFAIRDGLCNRRLCGSELLGTSNNTRFQRFLSWLSGRSQRSCRGESPIGDRFDAWPASVLCTMPHGLHP